MQFPGGAQDHGVRMMWKDSDPYFNAADVGDILQLTNVRVILRDFTNDEKCLFEIPTAGGPQQALFLSEQGLYKLIVKTQKPEAEAFRQWMFRTLREARKGLSIGSVSDEALMAEVSRRGLASAPLALPSPEDIAKKVDEAVTAIRATEDKQMRGVHVGKLKLELYNEMMARSATASDEHKKLLEKAATRVLREPVPAKLTKKEAAELEQRRKNRALFRFSKFLDEAGVPRGPGSKCVMQYANRLFHYFKVHEPEFKGLALSDMQDATMRLAGLGTYRIKFERDTRFYHRFYTILLGCGATREIVDAQRRRACANGGCDISDEAFVEKRLDAACDVCKASRHHWFDIRHPVGHEIDSGEYNLS